jgi:hypothetical protein
MAGRKPIGDKPLTGAERQARYREAHKGKVRVRYRRPADRRSRAQRWRAAVAELLALQADYLAWRDALPANLADSATSAALEAICGLDLSELEAVDPPRGYGRD